MLVVNQLCPNCGQGSYVRAEETWLLAKLQGSNLALDEAFPLIIVSCEICGLTQMFDQRIVDGGRPS